VLEVRLLIKAIIFDFGGVIAQEASPFIYESISHEVNLNKDEVKERMKPFTIKFQKREIEETDYWTSIAKALNSVFPDKIKDIFLKVFAEHSNLNPEVVDLVKKLKKNNYKVAILSNQILGEPNYSLKEVKDLFDVVVISFEVGMRKPDDEIYNYIVEKLQVRPDECIFIDNREVNLPPAQNMGMKTILFESSEQLEKELEKMM